LKKSEYKYNKTIVMLQKKLGYIINFLDMKLNEILFKKKIAKIIYRNLTEIIYRKYFATLKRCPIYAPNSA